MAKAYLCALLDVTTTPPTVAGVRIMSCPGGQATTNFQKHAWVDVLSFEATSFHEAQEVVKATLRSATFRLAHKWLTDIWDTQEALIQESLIGPLKVTPDKDGLRAVLAESLRRCHGPDHVGRAGDLATDVWADFVEPLLASQKKT
jgi:hypothetical protein